MAIFALQTSRPLAITTSEKKISMVCSSVGGRGRGSCSLLIGQCRQNVGETPRTVEERPAVSSVNYT
ncbi:hypothetical protein SRHO_G00196610 [Serrasalmus rhombeus]